MAHRLAVWATVIVGTVVLLRWSPLNPLLTFRVGGTLFGLFGATRRM